MFTALLIICLGIPTAVLLLVAVEDLLTGNRRITRARMAARLRHVFGTGLVPDHASRRQLLAGALRLFAWLAALGGVLVEMMHGGQGIAIWLVLACGSLEVFRELAMCRTSRAAGPQVAPILLDTSIVWLAVISAAASVGCLFGTFDLEVIAASQARSGFWTAAAQPLGCGVFLLAAIALCVPWRDRPRDVELIEHLTAIVWALLAVDLFGGGWHFWGIAAYTTGEQVSHVAAVMRALVVIVKFAAVLCGLAFIKSKCAKRRPPDFYGVTGNVLLPLAAANLLAALVAETWIRQDDLATRGALAWIVAGGAVAYGLMFHRASVTAVRKWWLVNQTEIG